jgi:hypothetical protein
MLIDNRLVSKALIGKLVGISVLIMTVLLSYSSVVKWENRRAKERDRETERRS